jgi:hypothetical protein
VQLYSQFIEAVKPTLSPSHGAPGSLKAEFQDFFLPETVFIQDKGRFSEASREPKKEKTAAQEDPVKQSRLQCKSKEHWLHPSKAIHSRNVIMTIE